MAGQVFKNPARLRRNVPGARTISRGRPLTGASLGGDSGTKPHLQVGQQGKGTGRNNGGGGGVSPVSGGGLMGGVGGMPQFPPNVPNFLPMTPGYESVQRGANDRLMGAEGQYALNQIMTPAELGLQKQRLTTDMGTATDRLKEDLANRGVYTAQNAAGGYGDVSPAGGGIGQSLYTRHVATPFGRSFQDLASQGASAYGDSEANMANAMTGYNQSLEQGLLGRAADAFKAQPLNLPLGGYQVPDMANASFPFAPTSGFGGGKPGRGRVNKGPGRRNRPGANNRPLGRH